MSPEPGNQPPPPPGAPAALPTSLEEPTDPQPPRPPKPEQQSPDTVSPTGADLDAEPTTMSQQGAYLTTSVGVRLRDTDHSLRAGPRGPTLLQDHHLREKITHFDHERIPERVVHARGAGAHGVFVGYGNAGDLTRAAFLGEGVETPVFVRFSTVIGSRGSADTVRDTRGFAAKFYTAEGTFDLVGNNMPVFFVQDGIKFPGVVHARGAGAHGVFVGYGSAGDLTRAAFLGEGVETPVFVRFSTVIGSRGSADTVRDTRGFAAKFYTAEGTFDLVGNNMPVFFVQDGIKFPDVVHAAKWHPDREIPQAQTAHDTFWDFVSLHTEAQHHTIWAMSDRAIPRSYRHMEGFGVHTFRLVNAEGATTLVKFHWKPRLGVHSLTWEEAQLLGGTDPDFHRRDLYDAIEAGAYPQWELGIQVFPDTPEQAFEGIDLLDPTKLVPEELAPVQPIGLLTLSGTPTNFFAESEQVAFHVGNLVPGIDVTDDPLLQVRLFSYIDTQLTRLGGPNYNQLPINRPHTDVNDMLRDGMHQSAVHAGVAPYRPNSLDGGCPFVAGDSEGAFLDVPQAVVAGSKVRELSASFDDHFSQARLFWLSMSPVEQDHIVQAYTFELGKCYDQTIRERQLLCLARIDADLASDVAAGLGMPAPAPEVDGPEPTRSPALSQLGQSWPVEGRTVGIVVDLTSDAAAVSELVDALGSEGLVPLLVAPTGGPVWPDRGEVAHRTLLTARSVEFDAVVVAAVLPPGPLAAQGLDAKAAAGADPGVDPRLTLLVDEAYRHAKAIGILGGAEDAVALGLEPDAVGTVVGDAASVAAGLVEGLATHRAWDRFPPAR